MTVLRNHFNGNNTILINDRIINGCQNFTLAEAEPILAEFKVPAEVWQEVLDAYTGTSTEAEIMQYVQDEDWRVRRAVARQGYGLDVLINDENCAVRDAAVAELSSL